MAPETRGFSEAGREQEDVSSHTLGLHQLFSFAVNRWNYKVRLL